MSKGDMVFENALLFMRDALIVHEFNDAIKAGDSGCVVVILKHLAYTYHECGQTKYAQDVLFLIHNLTKVWPAELNLVLKNWLVNSTGKDNTWVPVDLVQEHLNYWIKVIYKVHSSNASWEWLVMIAPCIEILRKLAR
ncbi:protein of unknown function DUF6589 [Abortiporus biennis]